MPAAPVASLEPSRGWPARRRPAPRSRTLPGPRQATRPARRPGLRCRAGEFGQHRPAPTLPGPARRPGSPVSKTSPRTSPPARPEDGSPDPRGEFGPPRRAPGQSRTSPARPVEDQPDQATRPAPRPGLERSPPRTSARDGQAGPSGPRIPAAAAWPVSGRIRAPRPVEDGQRPGLPAISPRPRPSGPPVSNRPAPASVYAPRAGSSDPRPGPARPQPARISRFPPAPR